MLQIKSFEFNMFGVNTYVVWDTDTLEAAVIDPGMIDSREIEQLRKFITDNGLKVEHLINTHLHIDHTFGDDFVIGQYGVKLEANESDAYLGRNRDEQARMFHLPIRSIGPLDIDVNLREGDTIMIGKEKLMVFEIPGHSQGSIVLYAPDSHFVITGDVLFRRSIGRTDLPGGSYKTLVDGISSKLLTLPDDTVVFPGHGPSTTIGEERRFNPVLQY